MHEIPFAFRRDMADESPVEPPPPEADERRDDGGGPHIRFVTPVLMVLSDGTINTSGVRGMLLQGWLWGASLFTAYVLAAGLWERTNAADVLRLTGIVAVWIATVGSAVLIVGLCVLLLASGFVQTRRWWKRRRG
jgi:hypothetical protein